MHHDSLEILDDLDLKQRGELFTAIYHYQIGKEVGTLSQVVKIVFINFKNQFDRDNKKYLQACETNRNNALLKYKKPIAPNGSESEPIAADGTQSEPLAENGEKIVPNHSDSDNDNESGNAKENELPLPESDPVIKNTAIEQKFLDLFNRLKKESQPESKGHKTMSDTAKRNLKRLLDKGNTFEDLEKSIATMLNTDWAVNTGNDTPEHLCREDNFLRYLNVAKKAEKKTEKPSDKQHLIDDDEKPQE